MLTLTPLLFLTLMAEQEVVTQTAGGGAGTTEYGAGAVVLALLGLVGYILRYVTSVTIPEMQKNHKEVVVALTDKHERAVAAMSAAHQTTVMALMKEFTEEQKSNRTLFREEAAAERAICERRHVENLASTKSNSESMMDVLKEIKDELRRTHTAPSNRSTK